jgi:hypothetical protein
MSRAKLRDQFRFIDYDDASRGGERDEFFARQGSASAFYHIEARIDFIGSIDADIYASDIVEIGKRDAQIARHLRAGKRSRYARDRKTFFDQSPDGFYGKPRRRACAEADYLIIADKLDRPFGCPSLGVISHNE